jgi:hypothetical protein
MPPQVLAAQMDAEMVRTSANTKIFMLQNYLKRSVSIRSMGTSLYMGASRDVFYRRKNTVALCLKLISYFSDAIFL